MIKTAIITSDTSIDHDTGPGHPEKPDRVAAVLDGLKKNENLIWKNSKKFDEETERNPRGFQQESKRNSKWNPK